VTISVIQGTKGRNTGVGSIASTGITTTLGSALVAVMVWDTGTFSSIADSKTNTWTQIGSEITDLTGLSSSSRARLYYSELAAGKVGASHTVTITQSGTSAMTILVVEVGGGTIPGIFDKQAGTRDTTSPYTSGATAATTQAIELLIGAFFGTSGSNPATHAVDSSSTPTSGWSITAAAEETNGASFYTGAMSNQRVTSTGTYACAWTETGASGSAPWTATFKEAAAGGTTNRIKYPYGMDGTGGGVTGQNRIH
jgi:hypothetical protein